MNRPPEHAGNARLGTFLKISDPAMAEIVALAGLDFVIVDMEHGAFNFESAQNMIRAAQLRGIPAIIRVGSLNHILIQRALDIGADGVQIPQVNDRDGAERCVAYSKFHPLGERGVCRYVRAASYSKTRKNDYFSRENEKLLIIQIEGSRGIENLESILQVEGIDVFFIGPYDLSQSLGIPGDVTNKKVTGLMKKAVELAAGYGKTIGTFTDTIDEARYWLQLGVAYLAFSVDTGVICDAYSHAKEEILK